MSFVTASWSGAFALWLILSATADVPALSAQGLPAFTPINPMATSRSGLYFQPYSGVARREGWAVDLELDYATVIEYNELPDGEYILDAELLRLNVTAKRDVGARAVLLFSAGARGAYDGFMDGLLDWYHGVLGISLPERNRRPRDEFLYRVAPEGVVPLRRGSGGLFLNDVRLGAGWRYSPLVQGVVSITLPTATGPEGYGRGVASLNVLHTLRAPIGRRVVYEGSVGMGHTPAHGRLRAWQREMFASVTSGLRIGVWGRQALYMNVFYHSPYYRSTALPALDEHELSLDAGWLVAACNGAEWRIGLTEDPKPSGPGIDLMIRLGVALRRETAPCAGAGILSPPAPAG